MHKYQSKIIRRALKSLEGKETTKLRKATLRSQIAGVEVTVRVVVVLHHQHLLHPTPLLPHHILFLEPHLVHNHLSLQLLKKGRRKELKSCWASFFVGMIFLSMLPKTIPFTKLRLMISLLLAQDVEILCIWGSISCAIGPKFCGGTRVHLIYKTQKWI